MGLEGKEMKIDTYGIKENEKKREEKGLKGKEKMIETWEIKENETKVKTRDLKPKRQGQRHKNKEK